MPTAVSQAIEFVLNGRPISIENYSPQTTLLDFLRDQGLTGAKEGCAEGECGACTVVFVAGSESGSAYRPVNSCLMFLPMASGQEIYTVESLAQDGKLAEVQEALAAAGGSQCGYCTPGFVMSLFAEQYRPDRTGPCDPNELGGNLCRCTGYRPIRDAALSLGPAPDSSFRNRLARPAPDLRALEYQRDGARFSRPGSLEEFVSLMAADPGAQPIAGGTDLGVESNLRHRRWRRLVSLEAIDELREFSETNESVRIGAALPLTDIARQWRNAPEILHVWMRLFASPAIRNRATLGGNLATASPIGDAAPLLAAFNAVVHVAGPDARRIVPLSSFFTGYRRTVLLRNELLKAIEIPKPMPSFMRFYKVAKRRVDDISTVATGMAMDWDDHGRISRARFAFGGVAATPVRATDAEDAIIGQRWNESTVERVQNILERTLSPISDHRGSAEYRLEVAKSLVEKFWWEWTEEVA
jgi:xanthine dehydrogenase small subunit